MLDTLSMVLTHIPHHKLWSPQGLQLRKYQKTGKMKAKIVKNNYKYLEEI
jgi:hypothetical protein